MGFYFGHFKFYRNFELIAMTIKIPGNPVTWYKTIILTFRLTIITIHVIIIINQKSVRLIRYCGNVLGVKFLNVGAFKNYWLLICLYYNAV